MGINVAGVEDMRNEYEILVKSVLTYGAETWSFYEYDRGRIDAAEMDE